MNLFTRCATTGSSALVILNTSFYLNEASCATLTPTAHIGSTCCGVLLEAFALGALLGMCSRLPQSSLSLGVCRAIVGSY
jgi:hypothetical protein